MYLTPSAWVSVMKNGMKLSEVTWVAGGGGISFSSSIREASRIRRVYLWGRWGLESLEEVIEKSTAGPFPAHKEWTSVFESY